MELNETVDLLREMISDCSDLNGDDFLISPPKIPGSLVEGYQLHITGKFSEAARKYLNDIAIKRSLAVTQHPDSVMLYTAKAPNAR